MEADSIRWLHLNEIDIARLRDSVVLVVAAHPGVIAAYHYGSSARRQSARDIDVGLVVEHTAVHQVEVEAIAAAIAARSGGPPEDLDVRVLNGGDPVFLGNVMRDGHLLWESDREARIAFEVRAMSQWLDFRPAWESLCGRVLSRWSHG